MQHKNKLLVIIGPTASGKTKLAVRVAASMDGEIISADSRQVYKDMNIGTGKDYEEYTLASGQKVPYHLIDIVEAGDDYHVARFQQDFKNIYENICSRKKTPILCGGSGMYIEAVLKNYQHTQVPINLALREELDAQSLDFLLNMFSGTYEQYYPLADTSTKKRLIRAIEIGMFIKNNELELREEKPLDYLIFGIDIPAEVRRERITKRLHKRLQGGMIEEVQHLLNKGVSAEKLVFYGLEYKFITEYLLNKLSYDEMARQLEVAIHQFAKRQMTFFRSMEKKGLPIHWLNGLDTVENLSDEIIARYRA